MLVNHFLHKYAAAMNRAVPRVAAKALDVLMDYAWPGNVRELGKRHRACHVDLP